MDNTLGPPQTRRVVVGIQDAQDLDAPELPTEPLPLNMGPSHPAMHGTVRIVLELSGENIQKADVQIGYLHRGFEKMCERGNWTQVFPYADRLNYVSPMLNNVGFALAVEKMLGVTVPERCAYYRVVLGELVGEVERVAAAPDVGDPPVDGDEVGEQVVDGPALAGGRRVEAEVGVDEAGDLVGGAEQGGTRVVHGGLLREVGLGRDGGAHASPMRSRKATHIR